MWLVYLDTIMNKLPTKFEVHYMKFSSLACRIDEWIRSHGSTLISKTRKEECAGTIKLLEQKLSEDPGNESRIRLVQRLKRNLDALTTYAEAINKKKSILSV